MKYNKIFIPFFIFLFLVFACKSNNEVIEENASTTQEEQIETDFSFSDSNIIPLQDPITIDFGNFEEMTKFSKTCQNGQYTEGQVVIIDGEISIFSSAAVGQRKDGEFIGTTLEVNGWSNENYPEDGSRIKVTAKVVKNKDFWFEYLEANPEDITVIEE